MWQESQLGTTLLVVAVSGKRSRSAGLKGDEVIGCGECNAASCSEWGLPITFRGDVPAFDDALLDRERTLSFQMSAGSHIRVTRLSHLLYCVYVQFRLDVCTYIT